MAAGVYFRSSVPTRACVRALETSDIHDGRAHVLRYIAPLGAHPNGHCRVYMRGGKKNASRNIRLEMAPACLDYKERVAEGRKSRASIYLYGELARGQPSVMRRLYGCRVACVMVNCTSWSDMGLGGCEWPVLNIELEMSLLGWGLIVMDKDDVPTRSKKATFAFFVI